MKTENIIQQKSFVFAIRIINACKYLKKEKHEFIIAKQMLRSVVSIGENVEEAIGHNQKLTLFTNFLFLIKKQGKHCTGSDCFMLLII